MSELREIIDSYKKQGSFRVLLTAFYFNGFHGSMMHICEIGMYLKSLGADVYIASCTIENRIAEYVENLGLKLYQVKSLPLDEKFDIVWSYHYPLFPYLLENGLKYDKLIYGCLSGMLIPMETPNILLIENETIPVWANSMETKTNLIKEFPFLENRIDVLLNFVPDEFLNFKKTTLSDRPFNIAIISNHIPDELYGSIGIFKSMNINVKIYGEGNNILVTPQILNKYDVIITIGKTVQYALSMGIPVYNYDYLGGVGYISVENIDDEEFYNFSGRSRNRKVSAKTIVSEVIQNYEKIKNQMPEIQKIAEQRYILSKNVDKVILKTLQTEQKQFVFDEKSKLYLIQNKYMVDEISSERIFLADMRRIAPTNGICLILKFNYYTLKVFSKIFPKSQKITELKRTYKRVLNKLK